MTYEMPEGVKFLELSFDKITELWGRLKGIDGIYDDFSRDNFELFRAKLVDPRSVWLESTEGFGILHLTNVIKGLSATGHVLYWDKKLRGREDFTLEVMTWLMEVVPLTKLNLYLPDYARVAKLFAERLNFHREGKIRRWSFNNGKPFDMYVYGITYEEARDGRVLRTKLAERRKERESGVRRDDTELPDKPSGETSTGHTVQPTSSKSDESINRTPGSNDGTILQGTIADRGNGRTTGAESGPLQNVDGGPDSKHNLPGEHAGNGTDESTGPGDDKGSSGVRSGDSKGSDSKSV